MTPAEIISIAAPFIGLVAPFLVYFAARQKMGQESHRDAAQDENTLWERMTVMLERYGKRADELEQRVRKAELDSHNLAAEMATLRGTMTRWRNFALALVRQIQAANITPLHPADFGLGDED